MAIAEAFTVVAGDHDHRVVVRVVLLEPRDHAADLLVLVRDAAIVLRDAVLGVSRRLFASAESILLHAEIVSRHARMPSRETRVVWRGRYVRKMRIHVVQEHEER